MLIDRAAFFAAVRSSLFGGRLSEQQVRGMQTLLDAWERLAGDRPLQQLAYILATVFHETGRRMVPVREGFAKSDVEACAAVARLHAQGRISRNYALPVHGVSYYGRGRVQVTHLANYRKLQERFGRPFVAHPDLLLNDAIDAEVAIVGHLEGLWTGRRLDEFLGAGGDDPTGARRVVNGTDQAGRIATHYGDFRAALEAAALPKQPRLGWWTRLAQRFARTA